MVEENKKRFHRILILGILSCCVMSCHIPSHNNLGKKICNLNMECGETVTMDLSTLIGVEYDEVYIFGDLMPDWFVSEITGINLSGVPDDAFRVILLKDNQIVYDDITPDRVCCCTFAEMEAKNTQMNIEIIHKGYKVTSSILPGHSRKRAVYECRFDKAGSIDLRPDRE